jgi:hypothetical protein
MRVLALLVVSLSAVLLAGCGTSQYEDDPLYDAGFADGCETGADRSPGTPVSNPVRDQALWDQSEAYRAGWKAGYGSCSPGARGDIPGSDRDMGGR